MSDLERDIAAARAASGRDKQVDLDTLRKSQRLAGEIVRKYEAEMVERHKEEMLYGSEHYTYS